MAPNFCKVVLDFDEMRSTSSRAAPFLVTRHRPQDFSPHLKTWAVRSFRRVLLEYPTLPQGELERIEHLEQCAGSKIGLEIRFAEVEHDAIIVDIPEDVARFEKLLAQLPPPCVPGVERRRSRLL